jgi:hypothetical protein
VRLSRPSLNCDWALFRVNDEKKWCWHGHFLTLAAELAGINYSLTAAAGRLVLPSIEGDPFKCTWSTLNNDGFPLQLCVSTSRSARTVRLLGDPTAQMNERAYADAAGRFERARQALRDLFQSCDSLPMLSIGERILRTVLPTDAAEMARMAGPLWLAAGLGCPGVAVYVNARSGTLDEQWDRVVECLKSTTPRDEGTRTIDSIRPSARPASVGLEGSGPGDARVKVYWRLRRAAPLTELDCPLLLDPSLARFLDLVVGQEPIPISGLVFGVAFGAVDGKLRDGKIDVCAHCRRLSAAEWLDVIGQLTRENDLIDSDVQSVLYSGKMEVAVLGFGVDVRGQKRLNLYLKSLPS